MMEEKERGEGAGLTKIDIKQMDEQLSKLFRRKSWKVNDNILDELGEKEIDKEDWEIEPQNLTVAEAIARGSFGSVHRGLYNDQAVAVKIVGWGEETRRTKEKEKLAALMIGFKQEVSVWRNLNHPNITKFIGATMSTSKIKIQSDPNIGIACNLPCVITEYLPGGSLKSYLMKNPRWKLAFKIVVQLALDLARGLSYLHSRNIVHRDIKTANLLLDNNRRLKITDFGAARRQALNPNEMTGSTGTVRYMAPEVIKSEAYDRKCDVYSFGICLWEIYCRDRPYGNLNFYQLTSAVVHKNLRPTIPKHCPDSLAQMMKRCWDADPNKRPEMEEVVSMLEAVNQTHGCFCFSPRSAHAYHRSSCSD